MNFRIERKETGGKGKFYVEENGEILGELLYSLQNSGVMTLDHTEVSPLMSGKGLASQLVRNAVDFAKERNYKINPMCTYAARQFERHQEYKEVQLIKD